MLAVQVDDSLATGLEQWRWQCVDLDLLLEQYADSQVIQQYKQRKQQLVAVNQHDNATMHRMQVQLLCKVVNDFMQQLRSLFGGGPQLNHSCQDAQHPIKDAKMLKEGYRGDRKGTEGSYDVLGSTSFAKDMFSSSNRSGGYASSTRNLRLSSSMPSLGVPLLTGTCYRT